MIIIGDNLKNLRKEKGLSFRKLAKQVGISHNILAVYERNESTPSLENALKICKFFMIFL